MSRVSIPDGGQRRMVSMVELIVGSGKSSRSRVNSDFLRPKGSHKKNYEREKLAYVCARYPAHNINRGNDGIVISQGEFCLRYGAVAEDIGEITWD